MRKQLRVLVFGFIALIGCGDDDVPPEERDSGKAPADGGGATDAGSRNIDAGTLDATVKPGSDAQADATLSPPSDAQVVDASLDAAAGDASLGTHSFVYVGGWDWSGAAYPFLAYSLDHGTGALKAIGQPLDFGANPSSIARNSAGDRLYIPNEYEGENAGVTVASVDRTTGVPSKLGEKSTATGAFVYSAVHPNGKYLFAADYYGGTLAVYAIESDGKLGAQTDRVQFDALDADTSAQPHAVAVHPNGKWVYVPNKALNNVAQLSFDVATGKLDERNPVESKGGPRHIAIYGEWAFLIHEDSSTLTSFKIDANGNLKKVDEDSALPAGFSGMNKGAHVAVHPNGKVVYTSNRGHDSVALFDVTDNGQLTLRTNTPSGGDDPWDFVLDEAGKLLVLVNTGDQGGATGSLHVFGIAANGALSALGTPVDKIKVPTGVALVPAR